MRKFMLLFSLVALAAPLAAFADSAPTPAQTANANASCKAQQADVNFASTHGGKSFDQFYGKTGKGSPANAFGKCVSQAVQSAVAVQAKASAAALKSCKAALKADKTAFAAKYGAGHDALGKCVAAASGK